jgi:hypothetical protein
MYRITIAVRVQCMACCWQARVRQRHAGDPAVEQRAGGYAAVPRRQRARPRALQGRHAAARSAARPRTQTSTHARTHVLTYVYTGTLQRMQVATLHQDEKIKLIDVGPVNIVPLQSVRIDKTDKAQIFSPAGNLLSKLPRGIVSLYSNWQPIRTVEVDSSNKSNRARASAALMNCSALFRQHLLDT